MKDLFCNKKVIVTGHTGFKGSWLVAWLKMMGANVIGISLAPPTEPSNFAASNIANNIDDNRIDITDYKSLRDKILHIKPDFLFHLAAQPIVGRSYEEPIETWTTNLIGTVNVLDILREFKQRCTAIIITSDKCYDNVEWVWGYKETDSLGGPDPYSASKGAAELAIKSYCKSFFSDENKVRLASARAGNVIGGGDWAQKRIIPDCVSAWAENKVVELRNPNSTRPWQHVLEPLGGYLLLAKKLHNDFNLNGEAFNFGPAADQNHSVLKLVEEMSIHWKNVKWKDISTKSNNFYESGLLKLNCDKALHKLNWKAVLDFETTIKMTAEWYKSYYENPKEVEKLTYNQISEYMDLFQG